MGLRGPIGPSGPVGRDVSTPALVLRVVCLSEERVVIDNIFH